MKLHGVASDFGLEPVEDGESGKFKRVTGGFEVLSARWSADLLQCGAVEKRGGAARGEMQGRTDAVGSVRECGDFGLFSGSNWLLSRERMVVQCRGEAGCGRTVEVVVLE